MPEVHMKARWFPMFLILGALALPVRGQDFVRSPLAVPDGEKKVGEYVLVWSSGKIAANRVSEIGVSCPPGYVAIAGGYQGIVGRQFGGFNLYASRPNLAADGWVIEAAGTGVGKPTTMTVYATCAPSS
jgi:hypothetical protein